MSKTNISTYVDVKANDLESDLDNYFNAKRNYLDGKLYLCGVGTLELLGAGSILIRRALGLSIAVHPIVSVTIATGVVAANVWAIGNLIKKNHLLKLSKEKIKSYDFSNNQDNSELKSKLYDKSCKLFDNARSVARVTSVNVAMFSMFSILASVSKINLVKILTSGALIGTAVKGYNYASAVNDTNELIEQIRENGKVL